MLTNFPILPPNYRPVTSVQPFTYKDGESFLEVLQSLRNYITKSLIPWVHNEFESGNNDTQNIINSLIEQFNVIVEKIINSSIELQDPVVTAIFNDVTSLLRTALDDEYISKNNYSTVLDDDYIRKDNYTTVLNNEYISRDNYAYVMAVDYGVIANSVEDQTAKINAAISAARAIKKPVKLPPGTIKCDGQIIWPNKLVDIEGSGNTILDFTGYSGETAIFINSSIDNSSVKANSYIKNVLIIGQTNSTTTDCFNHDTATDTRDIVFDNIEIIGFRDQISLGNNAYLLTWRDCIFGANAGRNVIRAGGTNMGENLRFECCTFHNSNNNNPFIYILPTSGVDAFFVGCSFDFGYAVAYVASGMIEFTSCHFEGRYEDVWIKIVPSAARRTGVSIIGGELVTQSKTVNPSIRHKFMQILYNSNPNVVAPFAYINGLNVNDRSGATGVILFKDYSGLTVNNAAVKSIKPIMGDTAGSRQRISIGDANLLNGGSMDSALTINTTNPPSYSNTQWNSSTDVIPYYSHDTVITTKDGSNTGAAKFVLPEFPTRQTILAKRAFIDCSRPVGFSLTVAYENAVINNSQGIEFLVSFYDVGGNVIQNEFNYIPPTRGSLRNIATASNRSWETGMGVIMPPVGATICSVRIAITNGSGTFWFDDIEVFQI